MLDDDRLVTEQLRGRATAAVRAVVVRGLGIRGLTFAGQLLLARMLAPQEFGVMVLGLALFNFTTFLADGGLGAALIRRVESPTPEELQNLLGIQLLVSLAVMAVAAPLLFLHTSHGAILAAMMAPAPIVSMQAAGTVYLERALNFRPKVTVELIEAGIYTILTVGLTFLGVGLWAFPIAAGTRVFIGSCLILLIVPQGRIGPRFKISRIRNLLRFGIHFQLIGVLNVIRDQGTVGVVTFLSGLAAAGQWGLGYRLMQPPFILLESVWRVSYPLMSQVVNTGGRPNQVVGRLIIYTGTGLGLLLVPLAATADLMIPILAGPGWEPAVAIVLPACVGLLIGGPISAAGAGYLYARGDSIAMLRATAYHTVVWVSVTVLLIGRLGVVAAGVGWLLAGCVDAVMIGRALKRSSRSLRILRSILPLWVAAALATGVTHWLSHLNTSPGQLVIGIVTGEVVFLSLMLASFPKLAKPFVMALLR